MKIRCPYCGEGFELEGYLKDSILVQVIKMLPEFGRYGWLAWEYAELFRIGPPLNARKLHRIFFEVREIFNAGGFDFQKRHYEISRDGVAEGLRTVCNANIKGPLTGHNYLKKIMIDISEKERERRSKEDEKKLRSAECGLRSEPRTGVEGVKDVPGKVKEFLKTIG